ncbi:ATP-dependent protease La domain-containing protein, partial [Crucibulum laeve]
MSGLGFCFRTAAIRRALVSLDPGRGRAASSSSILRGARRPFSTSLAALARPSNALAHPRWVNSKTGQDAPAPVEEGEPAESEDSSKKDGETGGSASSSDSSSSSESGSSSADGVSDSSKPPQSTPPPADAPPASTPGSIAKQSVPEVYPQVLALPIARRPLFPGFYKAVVIRNPAVVAAIKEMMKRGQPYLGAFLLKDENTDSDVITDIDSVHSVGVFAQITSVFSASGSGEG